MMLHIISRSEAKAKNLQTYFTGLPCSRGHVCERKTLKADCLLCLKERQKRWDHKNKAKTNERSRAWYAANKEKAKVTRTNWRSRNYEKFRDDVAAYQAANKEKLKTAATLWQKNNPEKLIAKRARYFSKNKPHILELARAWAARNKHKRNASKSRRIAAKLMATPSWADMDKIESFYERARNLSSETGISHHVDHIIPLRSKWVCGLHVETNLQVLTAAENQSKSNRHWPDALSELRS